jgi:hypothetical protein
MKDFKGIRLTKGDKVIFSANEHLKEGIVLSRKGYKEGKIVIKSTEQVVLEAIWKDNAYVAVRGEDPFKYLVHFNKVYKIVV